MLVSKSEAKVTRVQRRDLKACSDRRPGDTYTHIAERKILCGSKRQLSLLAYVSVKHSPPLIRLLSVPAKELELALP